MSSSCTGHRSPLSSAGVTSDSSTQTANPSNADLRTTASTVLDPLSRESLTIRTEDALSIGDPLVKIILQEKLDIWKTKELSDFVEDYVGNYLLIMDFCWVLDASVKHAGHLKSILIGTLRKFEEEYYSVGEEGSVNNYSTTLEELKNFIMAGDPFPEDFFRIFASVYSHQIYLLETSRLQGERRNLDYKLGKLRMCRKLVANPFLYRCWRTMRGQREIMGSMRIGTYSVLRNLDSLRVFVDTFESWSKVEDVLAKADSAILRGGDAVVIAMEEIRKNMGLLGTWGEQVQ